MGQLFLTGRNIRNERLITSHDREQVHWKQSHSHRPDTGGTSCRFQTANVVDEGSGIPVRNHDSFRRARAARREKQISNCVPIQYRIAPGSVLLETSAAKKYAEAI